MTTPKAETPKPSMPRYLAQRLFWCCTMPWLLFIGLLWLIGRVIEAIGDAIKEGVEEMHSDYKTFTRLVFSIDKKERSDVR